MLRESVRHIARHCFEKKGFTVFNVLIGENCHFHVVGFRALPKINTILPGLTEFGPHLWQAEILTLFSGIYFFANCILFLHFHGTLPTD